jgi:hypothetical protein
MTILVTEAASGVPFGIRTAECPRTGLSLVLVHRANLPAFLKSACNIPVAYLLMGGADPDRPVRVGETMNAVDRISKHRCDATLAWADCVLLIHGSAVDKLTAHAMQFILESMIREMNCATLMVGTPAGEPHLGEADWRSMKQLTAEACRLLPKVGVNLLPTEPPRRDRDGSREIDCFVDVDDADEIWDFDRRNYKTTLVRIADNFYLLAGSEIRAAATDSARR